MSSKKFLRYFFIIVLGYIAVNAIAWHVYTSDTMGLDDAHAGHASLMRFGMIVVPASEIPSPPVYKRIHMEYAEYNQKVKEGNRPNVDVLTLGDSFSNGGGGVYYQNYLTGNSNLDVLNISCIPGQSGLSMLYVLDSIGYLDKIKPKVVVIESIERFVEGRFVETVTPESNKIDEKSFQDYYEKPHTDKKNEISGKLLPGIMMKANWEVVRNRIYDFFHENTYGENVICRQLCNDLFTSPGFENRLLFFKKELETGNLIAQKENINENFNRVAKQMADKGITVIFMPAIDKYDVYFDEIKHSEDLTRNTFVEELETMPKQYILFNAKYPLRVAVTRGEKDVYWVDDDHWTWKGAYIVAAELLPVLERIVKD